MESIVERNRSFANELINTQIFQKFVQDVFERGANNATIYSKIKKYMPLEIRSESLVSQFDSQLVYL